MQKNEKLTIAVDFDGTCVVHAYPKMGREIGAPEVLKELVDAGHKIILYTMRDSKELVQAVAWFKYHDIPLYGINENPSQKFWTTSEKVYAHMYIDDLNLGTPLLHDKDTDTQYVDWDAVLVLLKRRGVLN